jgi:hypothetical protein
LCGAQSVQLVVFKELDGLTAALGLGFGGRLGVLEMARTIDGARTFRPRMKMDLEAMFVLSDSAVAVSALNVGIACASLYH